jgi:hypothetical protein
MLTFSVLIGIPARILGRGRDITQDYSLQVNCRVGSKCLSPSRLKVSVKVLPCLYGPQDRSEPGQRPAFHGQVVERHWEVPYSFLAVSVHCVDGGPGYGVEWLRWVLLLAILVVATGRLCCEGNDTAAFRAIFWTKDVTCDSTQ